MARIVDSLGAVYCSLTICRATRRDIVKILRILKAHTERLFSLALSAILSTYFYFVRVSWPETKKRFVLPSSMVRSILQEQEHIYIQS